MAALSAEGISLKKAAPKTTPQHMMAQAKRARFMATCTEVVLLYEGDKQITALVDSGTCLSVAPLRTLHRSQHLINKEQARQLCTATGQPMAMAGELQVRPRFKGSPRIFTVAMQIVDYGVPFILGADFLLDHEYLINYRTQKMPVPPTETNAASSTPITVNGSVKENMVAALFPSESFSTEEQTHAEAQQKSPFLLSCFHHRRSYLARTLCSRRFKSTQRRPLT